MRHGMRRAAGAVPVEADILQPAETLLDLYGEDIRARAYVTHDPLRGEMMLRPDFTVPVVQAHMAHGADPARYAYMGEVFRRQEDPDARRTYERLWGRPVDPGLNIIHFFELLDNGFGAGAHPEFQTALKGLRFAPYYGCMLTRPPAMRHAGWCW